MLKLRAVNPLKVAGFWPLLEEQINNFVEVWKYQQTNTFEKKKPFTFKMFYEIKQDIKPIDTVYKYSSVCFTQNSKQIGKDLQFIIL